MTKIGFLVPAAFLLIALSSCQNPVASVSSSASSSSSSTPVSSSVPKLTTEVSFDGVGNLPLAENMVYSSPVYGEAMAKKYPGKMVDQFHPSFVYDNQGHLALQKSFSYDYTPEGGTKATYIWQAKDTYSAIGTTAVPTSFLDNILFEAPTSSSSSARKGPERAILTGYKIALKDNSPIALSGSSVVAGVSVDMSGKMDVIKISDGTSVSGWSLKPNSTAYASASEQSFTILNAGSNIRINVWIPDPTDSSKTVQTGAYFTVNAVSKEVDAMMKDVKAKPFAQNYTAELVKESDQSVLVRTIHNEKYFVQANLVSGKTSGILTKEADVRFTLENGKVTPEGRRTYPLNENEAGVLCPFDDASTYLVDALSNSWASAAKYAIKAAAPYYMEDKGVAFLGTSFASLIPVTDAGNFVGVEFDQTTGKYTLSLLVKTVGTSTTFDRSGYSLVLSKRGESKDAVIDSYLSGSEMPEFIAVPKDLVTAYAKVATAQNVTLSSTSSWANADGSAIASADIVKGLINATALHVGTFTSYCDKAISYSEDKEGKTYSGAVLKNGRLYVIHGVPDYKKGGVIWDKTDVTAVAQTDGTSQDVTDLWANPSSAPFYSLSSLTSSALKNLNLIQNPATAESV
jgi:hypothetical protein